MSPSIINTDDLAKAFDDCIEKIMSSTDCSESSSRLSSLLNIALTSGKTNDKFAFCYSLPIPIRMLGELITEFRIGLKMLESISKVMSLGAEMDALHLLNSRVAADGKRTLEMLKEIFCGSSRVDFEKLANQAVTISKYIYELQTNNQSIGKIISKVR